jgi:hypothetical protein
MRPLAFILAVLCGVAIGGAVTGLIVAQRPLLDPGVAVDCMVQAEGVSGTGDVFFKMLCRRAQPRQQ